MLEKGKARQFLVADTLSQIQIARSGSVMKPFTLKMMWPKLTWRVCNTAPRLGSVARHFTSYGFRGAFYRIREVLSDTAIAYTTSSDRINPIGHLCRVCSVSICVLAGKAKDGHAPKYRRLTLGTTRRCAFSVPHECREASEDYPGSRRFCYSQVLYRRILE